MIRIIAHFTTPRWMLTHAVVLLALATLISFGRWQLGRLAQRQVHNEMIVKALNQDPVLLDGSWLDPTDFTFQPVQVQGAFDNEAAIFIRNQRFQNESGVDLVVPLRIEGSDMAVLVNRGWIPRGNKDHTQEQLAQYALDGLVSVDGIAYGTETRPNRFAPLDPPLAADETQRLGWFRVDIGAIQHQLDYTLLPIYIDQRATNGVVDINQPPVADAGLVLDNGPHLNYALQWFSFALILTVTYVFFLYRSAQEEI